MKKISLAILSIFLLFNMNVAVSYGEVYQPAAPGSITSGDVSRGLTFCRDYPVTVQIEGVTVQPGAKDVPPVIIGSRTLIPVRAFFEAMGATVSWDGVSRVVTVENEGTTVELVIDSTITKVNGKETPLDVPAMIIDHDEDGNGSTMVPLRFVSEGLGREVSWEEVTRTANVRKFQDVPVEEVPDDEPVEKPVEEPVDEPVSEGQDTPTFDTTFGLLNMLNSVAKDKLIAVDIGHGGRDTGAIAKEDTPDELYEKDVNLEVGLFLKDLLEQAGAKIIFTRESDVSVALYDRPALANKNGADIFISLHNNASERSGPEGTEVYYYSKVNGLGQDEGDLYGIYSKDIAALVQDEMVAILGTNDRGEKESQYLAVLNKTSMPAIVIEGAFMSNSGDLEKIRTPEYKEKYAYAVAKGLIAAMNRAF